MRKLLALSVLLILLPAQANAICLTKSEARKLWPTRHLYWYSGDHCWSNRRGRPPSGIKIEKEKPQEYQEPYFHKRALLEAITSSAEEDKPKEDLWPSQAKPIRVIEIIRPSDPLPVAAVEAEDLPPLPHKLNPSFETAVIVSILSGAFFGAIVGLFSFYGRNRYVKRCTSWIHQRVSQARAKISQAGAFKRNIKPPVHHRNLRDILRRVDRAGHADHLAKVLDCVENAGPIDEWHPPDDSAIAHWSRSIRAKETSG